MRQDDDVWNDRNAEDFLRYMKYDYYIVTLNMSMLILEYIVGFSNFNGVERMGKRDLSSVQTIYFLLMFMSLLQLSRNFWKMKDVHQTKFSERLHILVQILGMAKIALIFA